MNEQSSLESSLELGASGENWPDKETFDLRRQEFVFGEDRSRRAYARTLKRARDILGFTDGQIEVAEELLGNFFYGVRLVENKIDYVLTPDLYFNVKKTKGFDGDLTITSKMEAPIGYRIEDDRFIFNVDYFKALVQEASWGDNYVDFRGGMSIEDFMLLVGVHEAAHSAYATVKGEDKLIEANRVARKKGWKGVLASNHERRALIWEKAVADRYFPENSANVARVVESMKKVKSEVGGKSRFKKWLRKRVER